MPLGQWNLQWANHNSQRSYPLSDAASKTDETDTIRIPDSFLIALQFPVNAGLDVEPDKFFLRKLVIDPSGYTIALAYDDGSSSPPFVAAVNIARTTHEENRTYALPGADDFRESVGWVTVGKLDEIDSLPPGQYLFTAEAGQLEPDVIRPLIRCITSITLVNGTERSEPLYGPIDLVAGANMRLTANLVEDQDPQIIFDAIAGEGLNGTCDCDQDESGPCITAVNGVRPGPDGNLQVEGNTCMEVSEIDHGLAFRDTCSEACCGCPELDAMRAQLDRFADAFVTLQNFGSRLDSQVTQMNTTILGSRLGDQGCLEC